MATYRIEDYKKAGLPQEAERRMARIVELSSGLGYGAAEDRRNHKQFLEMIYKIKFDPKMETFTTPNAARSTNSIVAKAMNAAARNYDVKPGWTNRWSGELKPGTKITVVDSPMRYGGMAGEVVRRDGSRYVVRLDDIAGMEVQLNPNQISVKNADTSTVSEKAVNAKDAEGNLIKVGDTVILSDEGDYENPKEFKVTSISGKYVYLDDGHHEYEKDLLVYNSRACNAAGYIDASSVTLYPGDSVVFKAQYSSHKDDDEWLERNGDTVREVRGNEVKIGPSANDWAKKSDLMVWHNAARARNAKFNDGDTIEWHGKRYKVIGILGSDMRINEVDASGNLKHDGDYVISQGDAHVKHIANARACNAEFNVGDKVRIKNPNRQIGQDDGTYEVTLIRPDGMISIKAPSEKVGFAVRPEQLIANAACNAEFKPGEVVSYRSANGMTWTGIVKSDVNGWCKPDEILVLRTGDTRPHVIPKRAVIPNALRSRNARSRNDVIGRYKPGARVAVELRTRPIIGKVMEFGGRPEVEYSPTTRTRFTGTLIKQNGDKWDIKSDSGEIYKDVKEADFGLIYNSRSRNAVVAKALNARRARNDEQFHTYLVPVLRKGVKDYVTIERVADEKTAKELVDVPSFRIIGVTVDETRPVKKARNAEDDWVERFEVGGVYHGPYMNKDWLAKVLSRTDSSIRVAIKSRRDKTWHGKDEQVTLRINKRQAEEDGTEVAKGYGWEFWANDFE